MKLDNLSPGDVLTGPSGNEWQVFAVNRKDENPHVLLKPVKPDRVDGAIGVMATFDQEALNKFSYARPVV